MTEELTVNVDSSDEKKINIEQVTTYLTHAFSKAVAKAGAVVGRDNSKGSKLYDYQVEFMYLLDEIQRGPIYIVPKIIQDANQLITSLENEKPVKE